MVCWNRGDDSHAYRAVVSLDADAVAAWEPLPGGQQPNITLDEWHECDEMLRSDPALAAALARRGITDRSRVLTDLWAFGADLARHATVASGWAGRTSGTGAVSRATPTRTTSADCIRSWT